ncbi:MAG: FixH family protein [Deltaproteobacteria bacterium]|nr:FixH family protein [Deltaproteobacteria bacterium]MDQ3300463.1 FixH family protein [Myxococcota bacterium]
MRFPIVTLGLGLVTSLGACSGGDGHGGGHDSGASYNCAAEDGDDEFVVGISKPGQGGKLTFTLRAAVPAPPARGDNTWTLELSSTTSSAAVSGAQIAVTPFMPDHQHGTPISVVVEPMVDAGTYELSPVNLWMPGLWQTTIEASANGETDKAVFAFCIAS